MADDIKEPDLTQPIKRLNYFTGQFLQKEDFLDEQQYHMAMRRHGNRVLYFGKGILDESGFRVNDVGTGKIEVTPGIAIDAEGREIVLVTEIEIDLPPLNLQPNSNYVVTVEYNQQARDEQSTNDNDRSDFTRVLEEPEIKVVSPGPQSAEAIVIANLVTKADGTVEKIEYRDRQRAKARFAGDLTIGQGGNGSLNTRHINGKDWRNDTADDLYLNWNSAKNVVLGFGEGTRSSLHVSGNVGIGTTTPRAKLEVADGAIMPAAGNSDASGILFPLDPGGGGGDKAWIRYFSRYPNDIDPGKKEQMTLEIGVANDNNDHIALISSGGVGIGTNEPQCSLHVKGNGAIFNIEGLNHAYMQWYPKGLAGGRSAWIGYSDPAKSTLTIQNDAGDMDLHGTGRLQVRNHGGAVITKNGGGNGNLTVEGDIAVDGKHALRGSDTWLRLNQDKAFTSGVYTPGLLRVRRQYGDRGKKRTSR